MNGLLQGETAIGWVAIAYTNFQLGSLARYWHADAMALERQAKTALAQLSGRPANRLRFKGPNPAGLARVAVRQFTNLKAAFELVCGEEGADPDALVGDCPQGSLVLVLGDRIAAKAGELHEESVDPQAGFIRDYLAELRGIEERAEEPAKADLIGAESVEKRCDGS